MRHDRTPKHRLPAVLGCVILAAIGVGACGSDSGSGSSSTTTTTTTTATTPAAKAPVTRESYIARVDKLCTRVQKRQSALRNEAQGKSLEQLAPTLRKQSDIARALFNDIKAVETPPADRVPVSKFADSIRQISVYSKALAGSVEANHQTPMRNLSTKLVAARNREHQLGQGYGFKVCANGEGY